ncbi:hypothetical protein [Pseudomonas serbica]|uniref:hypothetical protein n=1 Tax=Pseudomonas serbica TaxID=2965074 RepID=UPI00237B56A6|nr:hypothetical protein [Pseudomonas serbica]
MSNNNKPAETAQAQAVQAKPLMDWDTEDSATDDFLGDVQGQEMPKACSILEPNCEACQ